MIITISGAHSGVGKTAVAEKLLGVLKGWSALKVTVIKKNGCPRSEPCGACEDKKTPFTIVSDPKVINQKGKDTGRMKAVGAKKVLWLKATPFGLEAGLKAALRLLVGSKGVVVEGTSVLKYLKPDVGLFIDSKRRVRVLKCSQILTEEK